MNYFLKVKKKVYAVKLTTGMLLSCFKAQKKYPNFNNKFLAHRKNYF